jgi:hypothetical protein
MIFPRSYLIFHDITITGNHCSRCSRVIVVLVLFSGIGTCIHRASTTRIEHNMTSYDDVVEMRLRRSHRDEVVNTTMNNV